MSRRRHRHGQSTSRDVVSIIFAFFLSLILLCISLLTSLRIGVMTTAGFNAILDDKYYDYALEYVQTQANYYTMPTGIDPAVLNNVFNRDELKESIQGTIAGAFDGTGYAINTNAMRGRLETNVRNAFANDGVSATEGGAAEEIVTSYVNEIDELYKSVVKMPGLDVMAQIRNLFLRYFLIGIIVLCVLAVIFLILIMRLHHHPHRALRYVAYAAGGAALMQFVVPCAVYASGFYKGLSLNPQYFYHFGVSLVSRVLLSCMIGAVVPVLLMVVLIVVIGRLRKRSMKGHSHMR